MNIISSKLILLTSITFMTACSTHTVKPEKLTTLQIMGISKPNTIKKQQVNPMALLPMAKTYPIISLLSNKPNDLNLAKEVESEAKQLLGIKYVWGATGPYTYDCSGFTQKIYGDAGINIPRVSRDQARVGRYVSYNDLQKGDMVFFDTKKKRSGRVSHVGIYLGAGNFIHASSAAKKIVIYNFNEKKFYKKRFLWGRRVIRDNYFMASL